MFYNRTPNEIALEHRIKELESELYHRHGPYPEPYKEEIIIKPHLPETMMVCKEAEISTRRGHPIGQPIEIIACTKGDPLNEDFYLAYYISEDLTISKFHQKLNILTQLHERFIGICVDHIKKENE